MIITALMWGVLVIFATFGISCAFCTVLAVLGVFVSWKQKDTETCVMLIIFTGFLIVMGACSVFAALAIGRNLII